MPAIDLTRLHLKIGTKAQYEAKKSSLDASNTLAMTPLAEEFESNTEDGTGKFKVAGTVITTLNGTRGNATSPVYLNSGTLTLLSGVGSGTQPVYVSSAGSITGSTSTVGRAGSATVTAKPVFLKAGTITECNVEIPIDYVATAATYFPVYMANDTTAGSIAKIAMPNKAIWSFSPSNKKWKYTTTDGTALDFGLTKVTSW